MDAILKSTHTPSDYYVARGTFMKLKRSHRPRYPHYAESANGLDQLTLTTTSPPGESIFSSCACSAAVVCVSGIAPSLVGLKRRGDVNATVFAYTTDCRFWRLS